MAFLECKDIFIMNRAELNRGDFLLKENIVNFNPHQNSGQPKSISLNDILSFTKLYASRGIGLRINKTDGSIYHFIGFTVSDYNKIEEFFLLSSSIKVERKEPCLYGRSEGELIPKNGLLHFQKNDKQFFEIPMEAISNASNGKNEINIQFHNTENAPISLVEMRFHVDPNSNPSRNTDLLIKEKLDIILNEADIIKITGDVISEFRELSCLVPRGKYTIKLYENTFQLHGKSYDFKIPYRSLIRLFLMPHSDQRFTLFAINVDPAVRQGQTRYNYIVFQLNNAEGVTLNSQANKYLDTSQEESKSSGDKVILGKVTKLFPQLLKNLSKRKLIIPDGFNNISKDVFLSCCYKTSNGLLYPLKQGILFLYKPTIYIRVEEVSHLTFGRGSVTSRTFDIQIVLKNGQSYDFTSIDKNEYPSFRDYILGKDITIKSDDVETKPSVIDDYEESVNSIESSEDEDFNVEKETKKLETNKLEESSESTDLSTVTDVSFSD